MILKNCKVKWAHVHEPNNSFRPPTWSINVYLSGEQLNAVKAEGLPFKTDHDGAYIICKRKTVSQKGTTITPPRVVDMNKQPFTKDIGNGSVCNIIFTPFDYDYMKKTGKSAWLDAVQVVEWVEYVGREDFEPSETPTTLGALPGATTEDGLPF